MDRTFRNRVENAINTAVNTIRELAPKDTGNLAYNAIQLERVDDETFKIYIDEAIAPYMPFTNEQWLSARWRGKKNPNEAWFNRAAEIIIHNIAADLGGEVR